jgi:hypothetical protein
VDAIQLLREMHADTKLRFKVILADEDPASAQQQWQRLKPLLDLHEELEDQLVYSPIADEQGPGTPLGDWLVRHDADVATVKELIADVDQLDPKQPEWRMSVARVMDVLFRHVMDEEGQIFGRISQVWGPDRLATVGAQLEKRIEKGSPKPARTRK